MKTRQPGAWDYLPRHNKGADVAVATTEPTTRRELELARRNCALIVDMRDNAWLGQNRGEGNTKAALRYEALNHAVKLAEAEVKRLEGLQS